MTTIILVTALMFLYVLGLISSFANWRFIIGKRTTKDTLLLVFLWWGVVLLGVVAGRKR